MSKIYTVYDSKAEFYGPLVLHRNAGEAIRAFTQAAGDDSMMIAKHPADFTLFEIGEYDDQTGMIEPYKAHKNLGKAIDFIRTPDGTSFSQPNLSSLSKQQ